MNFINTATLRVKSWLLKAATKTTISDMEGDPFHGYMAFIDPALTVNSWLPGVATDTAMNDVNNDAGHDPTAKTGTSTTARPQCSSQGSRRPVISRGAIRQPRGRVLRTKTRFSAHSHKWTRHLEFLLKFKKAAAEIGGAPIELIAWALGSNIKPIDLKMASAPDAAYFSPEATIQYYATCTLMKQVYQDIHVCSAPGIINSTADLAYFLGRGPSVSRNENWVQFNLALNTEAMFRVIEYAMAGSVSVRGYFSTTVNAAVNKVRVQPDTIGRMSDLAANEVHLSRRYAAFAAEHGWMMLSIFANSAAFREAARTLDDLLWISFNVSVSQNKNSIEYFAKIRGLNWTLALTRKQDYLGSITDLREEYPEIQPDHPHSHIVPHNSTSIRKPQYKGKTQINITTNRFRASEFGSYRRSKNPPRDPTIQRGLQCVVCGSISCHCEPSSCEGVLRPHVELVQSGKNLGVGIRVLQPIRKNQLLAEYVGEIVPEDCCVDDIYSIAFTPHNGAPSTATITSQEYGNWTRFVNHSCDAHAIFGNRVIGNKHRIMLISTKDIGMFEELTVDYGNTYWATRSTLCKCGSPNCRFATIKKRDETAITCGIRRVDS